MLGLRTVRRFGIGAARFAHNHNTHNFQSQPQLSKIATTTTKNRTTTSKTTQPTTSASNNNTTTTTNSNSNSNSTSNNNNNNNNNNNTTDTTMVAISNKLALGAGCYWGTEKFIVKDFQKQYPNSIATASVGFMSPDPNAMPNPSYRQVCSGSTGHVEVLYVELTDPSVTLEPLLKFFFQFHDPTTKDRQGNDAGSQYASVVFCSDPAQEAIARKVKADVQSLVDAGKIKYAGKTVQTAIAPLNPFYPAHEEHQRYLEKNPLGYCNHFYRFKEWPEN